MREPNYTINGNRVFRSIDWVCTKMHWKPSQWLPKFPAPKGISLGAKSYGRDPNSGMKTVHDTTMPFFDGYHFVFIVADTYNRKLIRWVFGQLFEANVGVYDWIGDLVWHKATDEDRAKNALKTMVIGRPPSMKETDGDD